MSMIGYIAASILLVNAPHNVRVQAVDSNEIGGAPIASYSSTDGRGGWTVDLYSRADTSRPDRPGRFPPIHIARFSRGLDQEGHLADVMWADSATCPKLIGVMAAIENLVAPRFDLGPLYGVPPEGAEIEPMLVPPTDAQGFSIRAHARQADRSMSTMTISGSSGAVTSLGRFAVSQMADCWSQSKPSWPLS